MKLAEALIRRADIKTHINDVRERLLANAKVQEGEAPTEAPQTLFGELNGLVRQFEQLSTQINRANLATALPDGATITDAIARRDALNLEMGVIKSVIERATGRSERIWHTEVKLVKVVDVAELQRRHDELARARRELDTAIQATNWATEI